MVGTTGGGCQEVRPCPFIQILHQLYPDFIQILSKFHLDKIRIKLKEVIYPGWVSSTPFGIPFRLPVQF